MFVCLFYVVAVDAVVIVVADAKLQVERVVVIVIASKYCVCVSLAVYV